MKKNLTRILSLLLVLVLMVGVLPVSALADGWDLTGELDTEQLLERAEPVEMQSKPAVDGYDYSIMFLDCGRKYYSVDSIKQLIDNASAAGFNYIQLAVGNDGLRFLLDDMKLTLGSKTYTSEAVSSAIHAGNEKYYNFTVDELTQAEMDTIIAYANSKGMGVIPCVNTPGHMDAILYAATSLTGENCAYNGSARTIDVTNTTAVAFTKALLQKYITYFAGKGCELFNMGADEYANDIYTGGSMGFGNLQSTGKYSYYVTYVNKVAEMIKNAGMTPMAFNDGIYFKNVTSSGTFDTEIIICYWSSGWDGGYTPMPAATLAGMGFKMVNTHGDYYWVLGKTNAQCNAATASKFNVNTFLGGTISNPAGAMFCIWADYPDAETEASVISKTAATIAAFGGTLPKTNPGSTTPVFKVVGDVPNGGTLTMGSALTLRVPEGMTAIWTASPEGIVQIEVPDSANANRSVSGNSVKVTALKAGDVTITATNPDDPTQTATFALTVSDPDAPKTETVTLTVGQTITSTQDGVNNSGADKIDKSNYNANIASVSVTGQDGSPATVSYQAKYVKYSTLAGNNTDWAKTDYFYQVDGNYYPVYAYYSSNYIIFTYYVGYSVDGGATVTPVINGESNNSITVYTKSGTEAVPASTTITFKGLAVGETSIKVGNVTYLIEVVDKAPDNALTGDLTLEYWITNNKVYEGTTASTPQSKTISTSAAGASTDEGIALSTLAPNPAYGFFDGTKTVYYWMTVRLDSAHKQTDKAGVDQTAVGTTLRR